jgi:hypothetical protein
MKHDLIPFTKRQKGIVLAQNKGMEGNYNKGDTASIVGYNT